MTVKMTSSNKKLAVIIAVSLVVKVALAVFAAVNAPEAKFMPDSVTYIEPGANIVEHGFFGTFDGAGGVRYERIRTPGYPLFLGLLNKGLGLSFDWIVVIQILLVTFAGFVVYKAAQGLDERIALLAAFFFLFDQPVTISTLLILSEALYTVFMAFFIYFFLQYIRDKRAWALVTSAVVLAIATYIRPVSYHLGLCIAIGVLGVVFRAGAWKAVTHAVIFFLLFYSIAGLWQWRNYKKVGTADFTYVDDLNFGHMGLIHNYARKGRHIEKETTPLKYYIYHTVGSSLEFFTLPGTLKYLKNRPLKVASKIYGYAWVAFWLTGLFFAGYKKLEHKFLLLTILYFFAVSVLVVGACIGSRFRAPVMPLIAILSASGWVRLLQWRARRYAKADLGGILYQGRRPS